MVVKNQNRVFLSGYVQGWTEKGNKVTFCSDGNIRYLDRGLGYIGVCIFQNSASVYSIFITSLYVYFISKLKICKQILNFRLKVINVEVY